ncbi:MAG: cyclic lactone autoinducer peptide [Lachnospiraceae bacterium]|nr:cyclic lactone autoinducer peptide [Lachnospiraceae bacterium]
MKKLSDVTLKLIANVAVSNAKKETNSACLFLGYQPQMPKKVCELKKQNNV